MTRQATADGVNKRFEESHQSMLARCDSNIKVRPTGVNISMKPIEPGIVRRLFRGFDEIAGRGVKQTVEYGMHVFV